MPGRGRVRVWVGAALAVACLAVPGQAQSPGASAGTQSPAAPALTDAGLAALLTATGSGVILIWSPHMPLSVDAHAHVAAAANALGVPLTTLLDPGADVDYARVAAARAGLPTTALRTFDSTVLAAHHATLHAPSVLVYADAQPVGVAVPGYRDAAGYARVIAARLTGAPPTDVRPSQAVGRHP